MWLRDHVCCHDLADSLSRGSAGVDSTTNRSDVATHDGGHEAGVDLLPADEANVRGLHHRIGGFNHCHQATAFDHSECFRHQLPPSAQIVAKPGHKKAQRISHKMHKRFKGHRNPKSVSENAFVLMANSFLLCG